MLARAHNLENTMARPRKPRALGGVVLADNLYPDCRGREGYYRYRKPDGKFRTFQAPTVFEANRMAEEANAAAGSYVPSEKPPPIESLAHQIPRYVAWRERTEPKLRTVRSWQNRRYALQQFAREIDLPINQITLARVTPWWDELTPHQQKLRCAEFRRLFTWLQREGMFSDNNPFTTNDELPRLYPYSKREKARQRLTRDQFWVIYENAAPALQIAMGISLTTFMRESDICDLRWDENTEAGLLRKVIGKSEAKLGTHRAARLRWDVGSYDLLRKILARARELSLQNYRCPYVVSHRPKRIRQSTKGHACRVTRYRLAEMFSEARAATGLFDNLPPGETPPTFHEIRSLAAKLARDAGYKNSVIQAAMAHERESTTKGYQEGHELPYDEVGVVLTEEVLGGSFG